MKQLKLSRRAKRHLADIASYTVSVWGAAQAVRYLTKLDDTIFMLRHDPHAGVLSSNIRRGCRAFPSGEHVIFYRVHGNTLQIVGILHEKMDPKRHL
ncbi:MAG: type II toxin-antitoxin system RelE/ParE family toxin [Sphingomonadales bacterium]